MSDFDIDIRVDDAAWDGLLPDMPVLARAAFDAALAVTPGGKIAAVSIALISDAAMQALNKTYRDKDKPTNVLSFPVAIDIPLLGDIVLARETVVQEAADKAIPISDHVSHLLIHGFLHLQGFDHQDAAEAEAMETLETRALNSLNIANPYEAELNS